MGNARGQLPMEASLFSVPFHSRSRPHFISLRNAARKRDSQTTTARGKKTVRVSSRP